MNQAVQVAVAGIAVAAALAFVVLRVAGAALSRRRGPTGKPGTCSSCDGCPGCG